jgi:hypothetical protein
LAIFALPTSCINPPSPAWWVAASSSPSWRASAVIRAQTATECMNVYSSLFRRARLIRASGLRFTEASISSTSAAARPASIALPSRASWNIDMTCRLALR